VSSIGCQSCGLGGEPREGARKSTRERERERERERVNRRTQQTYSKKAGVGVRIRHAKQL
jgi:hypothetical protein